MLLGTQPRLPGLGRATASSMLKGDPQRPHVEENQLHGDVEPSALWEYPDGLSCRELGAWGH